MGPASPRVPEAWPGPNGPDRPQIRSWLAAAIVQDCDQRLLLMLHCPLQYELVY